VDNSKNKIPEPIISIAVESWRFSKVFSKILNKLDATEQKKYFNQYRFYEKKTTEALAQLGLKIVNVEGQIFDPGMAVTPLNINEFNDEKSELIVDQMIEPILVNSDGVVKTGTVILMKKV